MITLCIFRLILLIILIYMFVKNNYVCNCNKKSSE